MKRRHDGLRAAPLAALLGLALAAVAAPLKTDTAHSTVSAVFTQMNVAVEAKFTRFVAAIDFDPAKPDAAKATVEIDTASLDLGDPDMNKEVAGKNWFNSAQFPKANFTSTSIAPAGAGRLTVAGRLTIKGWAADVTFPLTFKTEAGRQVFEGALPIKRLAFHVGDGEWKDTSIVADNVIVKFRVAAAH